MSAHLASDNTAPPGGPGGAGAAKRPRDPNHDDTPQTKFSFDFNPAPPSMPSIPSMPSGTVPVGVAAPSAFSAANRRESLIKPPSSFSAHPTHRETYAFSTAPTNSAFAQPASSRRESMLPMPSSAASSSFSLDHAPPTKRSENAAPQPPPMRKLTAPPSSSSAAASSSDPHHLGPAQKKQRTATGAAHIVGRSASSGSASTTARFTSSTGSARAAVNPPGVARRTSVASSGYGAASAPGTATGRSTLARSTSSAASSSTARRNFTSSLSSSSTSSASVARSAGNAGASSLALAPVPEDKPLRMDQSTMHALGDHIASQIASGNSEQMAYLQAQIVDLQRTQLAHQETYIKAVDERVEMEGKVAKMQAQLTIAESDRDRLRRDLDLRTADLADTRALLTRLDADHKELQAIHADQLRTQEAERQQEMGQLRIHVQSLTAERDALAARVDALQHDISVARSTLNLVSARELDLSSKHGSLRDNYEQVTAQLTATTESLAARDARVRELEAKVRDMEMDRRRLHNEIQELKGNIRVFLRVRPVLDRERSAAAAMDHLKLDDKLNAVDFVVKRNTADGRVLTEPVKYKFDKVFTPAASQAAVFDEIAHLVQSALDGYNVCILAYGQTGSGKTYTMEGKGLPRPGSGADADIGDPYADDERGMIPRAVDQIFLTARELREQGWEYEFCGQYVEIYNETVRDLLSSDSTSATRGGAGSGLRGPGAFGPGRGAATTGATAGGVDANKLDVVTDPVTQLPHVPGATKLPLTTPAEVHAMLTLAGRNRSVASTAMNDRSSRSHSVFILFLRGANALTGEKCESQLFLVDLAGSERIAKSGAGNDPSRLKEATSINKSLTALGDVVEQLIRRGERLDKGGAAAGGGDDDAYVGFRSSKLTHLLKAGLGGNAKALMFVNVSPLVESSAETKNSLTFASRVNGAQIGTARKNVQRSGGK